MESYIQLKAKRPLAWYNRELKTDFKKLFVSLSKSLLMFTAAGKSGGLIGMSGGLKEALDGFNSFELKKDTNGLLYTLLLKALINATHTITLENIDKLFKNIKNESDLINDINYSNFLDTLNILLESEEVVIDSEILKNPRTLSFLPTYCDLVKKWLIYLQLDSFSATAVTNRLPAYFILALNDEWRNNTDYNLIIQKIETPITEAARNELKWQRYISYLQQQIDAPIFDESFSLRQIYVPLRAYYYSFQENREDDGLNLESRSEKINKEMKPVFIEAELDNWLLTENSRECIRFLSGGPGSGKSSFAKMWAAKVAESRSIRVLFIPLHLFDTQGDVINSVGNFVKIYPELRLSQNPLESHDQKILIIFDGLDELSQQGKYAMEVATQFIDALMHVSNIINRNQDINALFLITGRELSIQNNSHKLRMKKQILHLYPYFLKYEDQYYKNMSTDEKDLVKFDQRNQWWKNYGKLTGKNFKQLPQELKLERLDEITAQPLLNYLVAVSLNRGKINLSKETNLNDIYADLIEGVYERAYEQHRTFRPIESLLLSDFRRILEEIALSAWHGGDARTTSVKRIEQHLAQNNLKALLIKFQQEAREGIIQLLTAFYFREHGQDDGEKTFEFTHKSFGEYLTATRLVKKIDQIHTQINLQKQNYDEGWSEEKAIEVWIENAGETAIDKYLLSFIIDEVSKYDKSLVYSWQYTIIGLISWCVKHGMPVIKNRKSHKEESRIYRNSSEALLVFHSACALKTLKVSNNFGLDDSKFGAWLRTLNLQRTGAQSPIFYQCLSFLNLSNQILYSQDFYGVDLSHSNLSYTALSFSIFRSSNLSYSRLDYANLTYANLEDTNLRAASLKYTNLHLTNLNGADLDGANLENANLSKASLVTTSFFEAKMSEVDLSDCFIESVDFTGADLTNANFNDSIITDPNFRDSQLKGAKFMNVIFSATDFTVNQLKEVSYLYNCRGLPTYIEEELRQLKPELFKLPEINTSGRKKVKNNK